MKLIENLFPLHVRSNYISVVNTRSIFSLVATSLVEILHLVFTSVAEMEVFFYKKGSIVIESFEKCFMNGGDHD
jgi:hypothetical protein